ncbi:MAG TPA: 50S ribosomal protein L29 [Longimicrobiaceae bacterium]
MKASEIRELTTDEILARIEGYQEEIFKLRFRSATQEIENPMLLRTLRRDIARLKTVLAERQLEEEGSR